MVKGPPFIFPFAGHRPKKERRKRFIAKVPSLSETENILIFIAKLPPVLETVTQGHLVLLRDLVLLREEGNRKYIIMPEIE